MVDLTPTQLEYATLRAFARKTNLEPLTITEQELNNELGGICARKQYNEDGTITITFEVIK
jgi:hypothetical protein